jgi:redox-sensitive bicupin YhaK (pirin superfamily)
MLAGRMRHRDDQGNSGLLEAGAAQWMTAGRGIVHSEMPEQQDGLLWGFQLWVNLPAVHKLTAPRYQDIPASDIPEVVAGDARVRVVAGRLGEAVGPVSGVVTAPVFLDVRLPGSGAFEAPLPPAHAAFVHVYRGSARVGAGEGAAVLEAHQLGALGAGGGVRVRAGTDGAGLLVAAGKPLREPVARHGPFVMNTREELLRAFEDYQAGRL